MFFFSKQIIIFWLLAFHTADGNIRLTTNQDSVNFLTTKNFIMNCTYEDKNTKVQSLQLAKLFKSGHVKINLVIMYGNSKIDVIRHSPYVKYTGGVQGKGKAYLSATWHRVRKGFGGPYKCRANIVDSVGRVLALNPKIDVLEEKTTFVHSVAAIEELQTSDVQSSAAIKELQTFMHKMQTWKESMVLAFNILERAISKTIQSKIYRNKYYTVYKHVPRNVKIAEDYCQAQGGYLAELNDWRELSFVASVISTIITNKEKNILGFYVSGRRNLANDKFYWPRLGKGSYAWFFWLSGKPNNHGGMQNCVDFWYQGKGAYKSWGIRDRVCDSPFDGFVCEMPKL